MTIKIILDNYEKYLTESEFPTFEVLINQLIPVSILFYSILSNEEIVELFNKINENKIFRKNRLKEGLSFFETKEEYIQYFNDLNDQYKLLTNGTKKENFLLL